MSLSPSMLKQPVKVLTIAGSDSGGAAGLQADLKTFTVLGVYGMSAVTVVTAQNSVQVAALEAMPASLVRAQIETVLQDYGAAAMKTGFLGRADLVEAVAEALAPYRAEHKTPLVVDPVLVNHRGEPMFGPEVTDAYRRRLLPGCTMVTPNRREAALLCGREVESWTQVNEAARELKALGADAVLITGAWRGGQYGDAFFDGEMTFLKAAYIETENTHGSGDTLSAAVASHLAQGAPPLDAVRQAQTFTAACIRGAADWRLGAGHGPVNHMTAGTDSG
ncbi:MAG: bifunctional hydroxymethylpyrimidine kinase/phosphomethylpyrimidine kinase [Chloroflexota bacterium]